MKGLNVEIFVLAVLVVFLTCVVLYGASAHVEGNIIVVFTAAFTMTIGALIGLLRGSSKPPDPPASA